VNKIDGKTTSTLHMEEQDFLDYFKDDKLKGKITKKLKSLTLPGDPDKVKNRADVKKQLDNIQLNSISNYSDLTKKVSNTTDTTVLQDIGLTTDKDNNTVSSKSIKDLNKKYSENVISRISNGKITEDDKYKDSDGKILPGFVKGGSTGDGDSLEVAGVTHKNEYVINEDSLKDIIEDVKTGNEESMVDKVTTIVKEVGENAKTTKSYEYLNKKIDSSTKKVSELANEASTYFNNTFKDKTYIEKPKLDSTSPLSNKVVGKITNFKQSNKEYKDTNEVFNSVKKDVESLVNNLTTNITNTKTLVTDEFNKFTDTLPKSFDEATTLFTTKFNNIKDSLPKSFDEIDISIKSMSDTLTKGFTSITDMIPDSFKNTMDQYLLGTKEVAKSLKEDFKNMTGVDLDKKYDEAVDYAGNKAKELGIDEVYEDTKSRVDSAIDKSGKYLHNVIVENPEETNPEKIKYRDAGDIASDIANDTKKTLKNAFDIDVDKAYDEASTFVGNLFNGNDTNKKSKIDESTEAKSKDSKPKIYTGITSSSMDKTKELDLEDKDEKINTTVDNVIGDVNNTFTSENETSTLDTVKEISSNIANETSDLFNKTFTNKPINSKTKFSVDNKGKNSLQNIQQFKVNTDKTTLDRLSDMFSSLTKSFSKTGDNISESLDKNNSVFESLTSRFPDYKDMTNFFNDTGNFITSLISSNDKLDGVKLPEDKTNNNNESKEEVGAINETFKSATKAVSSGYDTFKKLFDNHDMSEEMSENIKSINKAISDGDLDSVLYEGLMETPLPKSYSQAVHLYKKVINGIDPSGKLWNKLNKDEDFIPSLEKIHIEAIAKGQKGLLEKTGEKIDDGLDAAGGLVGKARDKLLGLIPAPVRKYVEPLLKNRFTEFGAKTIGHAKEIFKGAGKATLSELGMVGKNVKDAFVGKDGKVRLPNIYELAKLTGKTAVGTSKALSIGIKTLYPELFGLAKDTVGLGVSTLWDFLGIKKAGKTAMAKMKAIIIPPIDRKLYRAWTKGEITSKEVFDKLKTEKEQEVWTRWLKDNTRPGITLPEIMGQTGKWYIKTMYGVAAGAKAVTENKTVRDSVIGATKLIAKGVWNFTAGSIPGLHIGDVVTKSKESELTFIDLIQEEFIEIFVEQVATINEQLKIDNASLLNKPISNLKKQQANKLTRLVKEINSLYVELESSHKTKLSNIIDKKISQMLTYVGSIKELKKKPAKKKDKIKDVIDKKSDTKIKTSEKDTTDKDKKDDTILDKFINIVSGINDSITDSENIKSENKDKSTKKKDDKKSVDASNDKSKKDDNTILGTFKKSMETITETFSKKIDEVKVEPKEKKPEYSPFDKDKDGDRDGNRLDRMKKLYGNTKDKAKDIGGKIINKVKDNKKTLLGTLLTFSPLLIGMLKNMLEPAFKMFTNIKDGILSIPYTIGNIIAHSLTGIGKVITKAISGIVKHIPGVKTITSIVNGAKNLGNKAIDGIKNTFKIAPKGKVAKFLQTLRVLKKKVVKKLGVKAGGKILSKISSKLIPGVGEALLAWDIGWVTKYMIDGLSWKSAVSKQLTGYDFFKEDEKKEDEKVKDIINEDEVKETTKNSINDLSRRRYNQYSTINTEPVNNNDFTKNDSNRFKKKAFLANNLNFKSKETNIDTETKPNDNNVKTNISIGNVNKLDGPIVSPDGGDNNLTISKNVDVNNLNPAMKDNLFSMANEYNRITGKTIPINSAYRSYAYQAALKKKYGDKAASPGNSTHEFGLAIDMNSSTANELDKMGLMKKYGFTRPVGKETWHVEPAGIQSDINNAKHDERIAYNLTKNSLGKGGLGWGTKADSRKYSRNLKYQLSLMKAKGTLIPDNKTIIDSVTNDKATVAEHNAAIQAVPTHKYMGTNSTKNTKVNTSLNKPNVKIVDEVKPKTIIPNINVKNTTTDNSKDFDKLHKGNDKQSTILEKSLKVHYNTFEKISELVDVNKNMLSVLQSGSGNHSVNKQKNNNYSLPAIDDTISHSVNNY